MFEIHASHATHTYSYAQGVRLQYTVLSPHTHIPGYTFWKRPDARFRSANWSRAAPRSTLEKKSRRAVKSEVGLHGRAPGDLSHLYQTRLTTISYCGTVVVFPGLSTAPHRTCSRAACLPASSPPEATFLLLLLLLLVCCRAPAPVALDGCPAAARACVRVVVSGECAQMPA